MFPLFFLNFCLLNVINFISDLFSKTFKFFSKLILKKKGEEFKLNLLTLKPYGRLSTVLASNVTAAILVNALPRNVAPVVSVID